MELGKVAVLAVSVIYADGTSLPFLIAFGITLVTGFITWLPVHNVRQDLRTRDGFLITVLFWVVLSLFGSIPLNVKLSKVVCSRWNVFLHDRDLQSTKNLGGTTGKTAFEKRNQ